MGDKQAANFQTCFTFNRSNLKHTVMLNLFQHPTNKVRRQYLASGMPIRRLTDRITARVALNEKEPLHPVGALFRSL
jgi:hypothetical protein